MATDAPQAPEEHADHRAGTLVEYDEFIESQLRKTRSHVRSVDLAAVLILLLAGSLAFFLSAAVIDHWLVTGGLGFWGRLLLLGSYVVAAGYFVIRQLVPLLIKRINPLYAAYTIERSRPSLQNGLVNFLLFRENPAGVPSRVLEAIEEHDVLSRRAQGSLGFMGQATMLMSIGLLCLWMMLYYANRGARLLFAVTLGISVVGLAYTITRNAIGGFMAGMVWGVVFTRRRMPLVGLLALGALALVIQGQGGLLDRVLLRVTGPGGTSATPFMEGLLLRFDIWHKFVANFSPVYLFTGMGMTSVRMVAKSTAHNSYLGAFVYSGLTGAVVLYLILARAVRLGVNLRRYGQDGFSQGLGAWLCSLVVALCLAAFFIELFQQPLKMQVLFAAMVVADKQLARVRAAAEPRPSLVPEPGGGLLAYP